jgi:site-specific recombinase XerD
MKSYNVSMALYLGFLETGKKVTAEKLCGECFSVQYIEDWLVWLKVKRGCSPETCDVRLGSLRAFLKYLGKQEASMLYLSNAASQIDRRKTLRKKVSGMSKPAVAALLEAPDLSVATGRRDMALPVLMYSTAARIDEVLSLKVGNLQPDAAKPCANIIGKGGKIRTMYLLPRAVEHIRAFLREFHGDTPDPAAYLFFSRCGGGKLTQPAINKRIKKYAAMANKDCPDVPLDLHAHQIRHAKASHWLEDGMNIVQVSFLLDHEQLETTMKYLDTTTEQEAEALATLEDENTRKLPKKWKVTTSSLADFCGTKQMKI